MRTKTAVFLIILLLFTLSGCNNTPQTEKMPEPFSSSESNQNTSDKDTLPAAETSEVEPTPEPVQSTESSETQSTEGVSVTESSEPKVPEQAAEPISAPQNEPPQETEGETVQTTTPETEPETEAPPAPPIQPEATESEPPQETLPKPKSIYDFEFDIDAIRAELISVGERMGLTHMDGLTPDTASWSTPITASADFQGENLERRLKDYVQSMPELIAAYGGNPIQYFTIYAEPLGGGSYRIYFLY